MADGVVNLTIDGVPVSVPLGTLLIEAAKQAGVLVPHYCYHPGLPVAGLCRMCLVDIEKAPKLQIACATQVAEGMVVRTQSPQAKSGRMGVLELLLINHPLDCPICDRSGPSSPRISCTRRAPGSSTKRPPSAPAARRGATSPWTPARTSWCACARGRTSR